MADWSQFEGFETERERPAQCMVCEAMLPEAVDGTLSAAEQRAFEQHVATCVHCARELEEAQRGAAWLAMLKTQTPEPPARLLARILEGTTGAAVASVKPVAAAAHVRESGHGAPGWVRGGATPLLRDETAQEWANQGIAPAFPISKSRSGAPGFLAAWGRAVVEAFSFDGARTAFQPRLAMTAAMAFFSIALTLNLTGVRLRDLRASDFTPGGIRRTVADKSASAVRDFQNLRVVYQVESRVSELRSDDALGNGRETIRQGFEDGAGSGNGQGAGTNSGQPQQAPPRAAKPGAASSGDSSPQDLTPKGHSDLVLPLPERGMRGSGAVRKEV